MAKTLNQLGEATDLDTPDLLLARDTSTGDDKRITLNNSRFSRHGLTESVTLSTGTLTIPVGMSTIKLPTTVWDGSSNIAISAIAFEGGVQPAVGYEFSVVVPKTTTAGSLTAGALGNEVLIQDGASIAVEANNNKDLPCYPNAADNPGTDPVQFAAPYYRLEFRVDEYDGNGDPVVSLVRLPDLVEINNDRGSCTRWSNGRQTSDIDDGSISGTTNTDAASGVSHSTSSEEFVWTFPAELIVVNSISCGQKSSPDDFKMITYVRSFDNTQAAILAANLRGDNDPSTVSVSVQGTWF